MELKDLIELGISEEHAQKVIEKHNDVINENESLIDKRVGKVWNDVDLAILTHTKIPKMSDEKTTDYLRRSTGEMLNSKISELNGSITDLEEKLKNHKGDETLKKEIDDLKKEKADFQKIKDDSVNEIQSKYDELNNEYTSFKRRSQIQSSLPINFKKDLDSEFKEYKINGVVDEALKEFDETEMVDGVLYLRDSVKLKRVEASKYFEDKLKSLIDVGNIQNGGGANGGSGGESKELVLNDTMEKGEKISKIKEYILSQGISPIDPRYTPMYKKLAEENNVLTKKEDK